MDNSFLLKKYAVLGICAGAQLLNNVQAGKLCRDITTSIKLNIDHRAESLRTNDCHSAAARKLQL